MAVLQVNPVGLAATDEGYIVSVTIRSAGANTLFTPDGNGQITVSALATNRLVGGSGNAGQPSGQAPFKIVTG